MNGLGGTRAALGELFTGLAERDLGLGEDC